MACNIKLEMLPNGELYQVDSCSGISELIGNVSTLIAGISSINYNNATATLDLTVAGTALPPMPLFLATETTQTPLGSISNPNTPSNTALNTTRNLQTTLGVTPEKIAIAGNWTQANQAWTFATLATVGNRVTYSGAPLNAIPIATIPNPTTLAGALPVGFKWVAYVSVLSVINLQGSATGHSPISSFPMLRVNGVTDQASNTGGGRVANSLYFHRSTAAYLAGQAMRLEGVYDINQNSTTSVTLDMDIFYKFTDVVDINPALVSFDATRCRYLVTIIPMKI